MTSMSFMPELKTFLNRNGLIYTVRKYKMMRAIVDIEGVGLCNRFPLGEISNQDELEAYAENSGFQSASDWWSMVRHFVPDKESTLYLYMVEVR